MGGKGGKSLPLAQRRDGRNKFVIPNAVRDLKLVESEILRFAQDDTLPLCLTPSSLAAPRAGSSRPSRRSAG